MTLFLETSASYSSYACPLQSLSEKDVYKTLYHNEITQLLVAKDEKRRI